VIANEPDAPEMVESVPTPAKPKKKRGKKRRFKHGRRHRDRFSPELRRFWRWEEFYNSALNSLIQSLAVGRKITAKALVKMASDIADQGVSVHEKRKPKRA